MEGRGGRGNFNNTFKNGHCVQNASPYICATCTGNFCRRKLRKLVEFRRENFCGLLNSAAHCAARGCHVSKLR